MYLGIDLGTSNSAVVANLDGSTQLCKTADGTDVLPSVIFLDRRGHRFVGSRAYDRTFTSPENIAAGFKRLMGTGSAVRFAAAGAEWTPEECSAEIIRTLVSQAQTETGRSNIAGTVITTPAAFNQMQSEATIRAAGLAGLEQVTLLQEPVAAAMASIARSSSKNGIFLIYDLGGGTFDVALVQSTAGTVNILAHEGINMLGGRDFDRLILDAHVRPWLADNFDLPADFQKNPQYRRLTSIARHAVEKAKIELSTATSATIFAGDEEVRVADAAGEDIYLSIEITRADLDALVSENLDDSIGLCRKILDENGLSHDDVSRIVLIGGPTKMPSIRERVPGELGISLEEGLDPMIAVATGAAHFAESREWEGHTTRRKRTRTSEVAGGDADLRFDYKSRVTDGRTQLRVTPGEGTPLGCSIEVIDGSGVSTGKVALSGPVKLDLTVPNEGENRFRVIITDSSGQQLAGASREISVVRTGATAAGIPMTYTLAVKVQSGTVGRERNILDPLLKKDSPLPASGIKTVLAGKNLRAGSDDMLKIEFFEQTEDLADPELNLYIGNFQLDAREDLDPGECIRRGTELKVHWKMADSGLLEVWVEVPALGRLIDGKNLYVPQASHVDFEGPSGAAMADAMLAQAKQELSEAEEMLEECSDAEFERFHRRIERQELALSQSVEADTHRAVTEEARRLRQDIALLKHAPANRQAVLSTDLQEIVLSFDQFRDKTDPVAVGRFDRLASSAAREIRQGDHEGAERSIEEMKSIHAHALFRDPAFLQHMFSSLAEERFFSTERALHDRLVQEGEAAMRAGDIDRLRAVLGQMLENRMPIGTRADRNIADLADLLIA